MTRLCRLVPMLIAFVLILGLLAGAVWLLNTLEASFAARL